MLIDQITKPFVALLFALLVGLLPLRAITQVGAGPDASFLLIQSSLFSATLVYQYNYTYNPAELLNGYDLLVAVDLADSNLSLDFLDFSLPGEPSYFLNTITYNSVTVTNTPWPDFGPFWGQWASGGEGGYLVSAPYPSGVWSEGSGISTPYRTLAPDSWDGYAYNADFTPPVTAPIPEPKASLLAICGGAFLLLSILRRWIIKKHRAR
ncbi:MAG: hypothetical protein ABI615_06715 [Chthoniobacterales bacterium]